MKIGIISGAYFGKQEDIDGLRRMKKHGFDYMDYNFLTDTETPIYHCSEVEFEKRMNETRDKINSQGIEVFQTHGPWRWPPQDGTEAERAERFEKMSKAIVATKILGAKYFVIHPIMPFGWDKDPYPERFWELNLEFFARLTQIGKGNDVIVCLENMPMKKLSISPPSETLKMVKEIDSPYMKMCLDTGHSILRGVQPGEAVRQIGKEYLACLHIHDNNGERDLHWNPYTGVIDWKDFSKAINEIDYKGVMSLETDLSHSMHVPPKNREYFEIGLASLTFELTKNPE